jgi:5-formyltetrahydrofolate cyclo-ligase
MAVPRLALEQPFYLLNSLLPSYSPGEAATTDAAEAHALLAGIETMPHLDLVMTGCVAVNRNGARLGKGRGYADMEYGLLTEADLIDDRTILATTVHDLQVLDDAIPEQVHDFRLDLIVTLAQTSSAFWPVGLMASTGSC